MFFLSDTTDFCGMLQDNRMHEIQPDQDYLLISLWPLRLVMLDGQNSGVAAEAKFPIMNLIIEVLGN